VRLQRTTILAFNLANSDTFWSKDNSHVKYLSIYKIINAVNLLSPNTERNLLFTNLIFENDRSARMIG
jgi:hypothetical protein